MKNQRKTKRLVFIAILISLSAVLSVVDHQVSSIFALGTGIKIGLANIVVLICLTKFSFKELILIGFLKSLLVGLFLGTISTFLIGFTGTMLSIITMYFVYKYFKNIFSFVGVSFIGAIMHTTGQILAVMIFNKIPFAAMIPLLFSLYFASLISSIFIGLTAIELNKYVLKNKIFDLL